MYSTVGVFFASKAKLFNLRKPVNILNNYKQKISDKQQNILNLKINFSFFSN